MRENSNKSDVMTWIVLGACGRLSTETSDSEGHFVRVAKIPKGMASLPGRKHVVRDDDSDLMLEEDSVLGSRALDFLKRNPNRIAYTTEMKREVDKKLGQLRGGGFSGPNNLRELGDALANDGKIPEMPEDLKGEILRNIMRGKAETVDKENFAWIKAVLDHALLVYRPDLTEGQLKNPTPQTSVSQHIRSQVPREEPAFA